MSEFAAPRRVELILEAFGADAHVRDTVLGDLAEEFALRVRSDGSVAARRWYYRESVGVAPYLLRKWGRGLRRNDVGHVAGVVVLSSLPVIAIEYALQLTMRGLERTLGTPPAMLARLGNVESVVLPVLMLVWTLGDGVLAGYVAARLGPRAPLPSALALGVTWTGLLVLAQGHAVPLWFRAANVATLMAGVCAGAVIRACRQSPCGLTRTSAETGRSSRPR